MEKYITKKPLKGMPPDTAVYLILNENKQQVAQLTCDSDTYNAWIKSKNLEPLEWSDWLTDSYS